MIDKIPELEIVEEHEFCFSLLMVHFVQKILRLPINPEHKVTAYWKFSQKHLLTLIPAVCLDLDFVFSRMFSRIGITSPGLSMLVVCKRVYWSKGVALLETK